MPSKNAVVSVRKLSTWFATPAGIVRAVDEVSFDLFRGDILAIVGESGSGKSVTALSLLKLIPTPPGRYASGEVWVADRNMLELDEPALENVRGRVITMLFQQPRESLDPSFTVEAQLLEVLRRHQRAMNPGIHGENDRIAALLRQVGFDDVERIAASYPHQLSGGMCQRVALALGMACDPQVLIADEPTTALDVGVQARILLLLKRRNREDGLPIILITHDFGVVRATASRIIVMYAGQVQEQGEAHELLAAPKHPYTQALLRAIPDPEKPAGELYQIQGQPPNLLDPPAGCRFAPRCEHAWQRCREEAPALHGIAPGRLVRCHLFDTERSRAK